MTLQIAKTTSEIIPDADLANINLTNLFYARDLINRDLKKACFVLGIDKELAERMRNIPLETLHRMAASRVFLFRFRFSDKGTYWENFLNTMEEGSDEQLEMSHLHTVLMVSTETQEHQS